MFVKAGLNRAWQRAGRGMLAACVLLAWPLPAVAHAAPALEDAIEKTLASAQLPYAALGMVVADAATGQVRLAIRPEAPLVPASVMKVLTSAVALRTLGPGDRFGTRLVSEAPVVGGQLQGDLVLVGEGDPSLRRADLAGLAETLRARGIARVAGDLVVDASRVAAPGWSPGWSVDDLAEPYAAPVSALNLEENLRSEPATPSPRLVPDPEPALTAGTAMQVALEAAGVLLGGTVRPGVMPAHATVLAEHRSAPLADLLQPVNKESHNLYAEALFRRLGAGSGGGWAAGSRAVTDGLVAMGVASADVRVADGSGLSRYDLATPRAIARVLTSMHESEAFVRSLPVAGVDGTLARRFAQSPLKGRLRAKTGTMSGVSAIAGYMEGTRGRSWVVTITVNGFTGSVRPVQVLQDALLEQVWGALEAEL